MKNILFITLLLGGHLQANTEADFKDLSTRESLEYLAAFDIPVPPPSAKWVEHPQCENVSSLGWRYAIQNAIMAMTGNGWLLPGDEGESGILPPGHVGPPAILAINTGAEAPPTSPADLESDVRAVIEMLEQETGYSDSYSAQAGRNPGCLLVFATQLHLLRKNKLANDLADAVFALTRSKQRAMEDAIDFLGDERLHGITNRFFSDHDWTAYHTALTELHARFPSQWTHGRALPRLLALLESRLAGNVPNPPGLPDIDIDPAALAAVASLVGGTNDPPFAAPLHIPQLWMLSENRDMAERRNSLPELTALGIDALPVLAALLDDSWLTFYPNPNQSPPRFTTRDSEERQVRAIYQSIPRPLERGEVARRLLAEALPNGNLNMTEEEETESLRRRALDFWRENRSASGTALAIRFLQDGDGLQQYIASDSLITSKDPAAWQGLEQYILNDDRAVSQHELARRYLSVRQNDAKPFLDAYTHLVREQLRNHEGEDGEQLPWEVRVLGSPDLFLASLQAIIDGQSLPGLIAAIMDGTSADPRRAIKFLTDNRQHIPPTMLAPALLDAATAEADSSLRAMLLAEVLNLDWEPRDAPKPPAVGTSHKLSETQRASWKTLMEDTGETSESLGWLASHFRAESISDLAAVAISRFTSPGYFRNILRTAPSLGRDPLAMIREHAGAVLDGAEPPALPDPSAVAPERFEAIVATAASKDPLDLHPYLATLSPDERAAWAAWLGERYPSPEPPPPIRQAGWTIMGLSGKNVWPYPRVEDSLPFVPGFVLSGESMSNICEAIAQDIEKYSRTMVFLRRMEFGPGLEAVAMRLPEPHPDETAPPRIPTTSVAFAHAAAELDEHQADGLILLIIERGGYPSMLGWMIHDKTATPIEPGTAKSIDRFLSDPLSYNACNFRIDILSSADARRILNNLDGEGGENSE